MSNQTYTEYLTKLNSDVNKYFLIAAASIGIPCNLVSIFIFAHLIKHKTNMGYLYTIQCLVDLFLFFVSLFLVRSNFINLYPISLDTINDPMCKFIKFIRRYPLHLSSWMPVLITFDRFIFIFYGHGSRFKFMKKKLNITVIVLLMFTMLAIVNVPNLFYYLPDRVIYPNGSLGPSTSCTAAFGIVLSTDIISTFIRTYIPLALMVFLNTLMIYKVFKKTRTAFNQTSLSRREHQFTVSTMAFDVYFFLLNFPFSVFYTIYDVNNYMGSLKGEFGAYFQLVYSVIFNIATCQQTLSFFMYFGFNKLFRQKLLHLTGAISGSSSSRVLPTSNQRNNSLSAKNTT